MIKAKVTHSADCSNKLSDLGLCGGVVESAARRDQLYCLPNLGKIAILSACITLVSVFDVNDRRVDTQ